MPTVALLAHGAGSCPATARRLLGTAVPPGATPVAIDARGTVGQVVARIEAAAAGHDVALVAGISLGAHATALWVAGGGPADRVLLVMPAWTGLPGDVAALTRSSADAVRARGRAHVLADAMCAVEPGDWVLDELRRGWAAYDDDTLADALRAAATSPAPTLEVLATIARPTAVVALADDPLHRLEVAQSWAAAVPDARLAVVGRHAPSTDRGALGRAGLAALDAHTTLRDTRGVPRETP